jgi:hypothetical protein
MNEAFSADPDPEDVRRWRAEMDRLGYGTVVTRYAQRMPVTDLGPYPDSQTVEAWLREQQEAAERVEGRRFATIRRWTVTAAIAGIIAALASIVGFGIAILK